MATIRRLRLKGQHMMAIPIRPKSLDDRVLERGRNICKIASSRPNPAGDWRAQGNVRGSNRFNPSRVFPNPYRAASAHHSSRFRITVLLAFPCRCAYFFSISYILLFTIFLFSIFSRSVPTVVTLLLFSAVSIYLLTLSFCDSNSPER